ncbi:MAG: hypothetical protein VXZ82_08445 [Planctomycetota bacterium]|nr:hypothetical protein [Planctomycetota bacterium]
MVIRTADAIPFLAVAEGMLLGLATTEGALAAAEDKIQNIKTQKRTTGIVILYAP